MDGRVTVTEEGDTQLENRGVSKEHRRIRFFFNFLFIID